MRPKSGIYRTYRIALLNSCYYPPVTRGTLVLRQRAAVNTASKTLYIALIFFPCTWFKLRYGFCGTWFPGYAGIWTHMSSNTLSRLCTVRKRSIQSIKYPTIPRNMLCRRSGRVKLAGDTSLNIHKAFHTNFTPAALSCSVSSSCTYCL